MTQTRPFSAATRIENLERLNHEQFDILIIGGGITGTAAARDAALRGHTVALIDKGDFGCGTSSRSSRLIHGGLRYLEHFQFHLVSESVVERGRLLRNASQLVKPQAFIYPVHWRRFPPYRMLSIGLWLYDLMSLHGGRDVPFHRMLRPEPLAQFEPLITSADVIGAGHYYDATVDDSRLTLLTAKSAHHAGAVVANYAEAVGLMKAGSRVAGVQLRDVLSGRELEAPARVVVNAAGPWVDRVLGLDALAGKSMLRPTKGAHIIVPRSRLPVRHAVVMRSPRDRRPLFIVPWGDFAIVGTTDTDYCERPEDAQADPDDCAYLLESVRALMPGVGLCESDVISTYAGVRPLVAEDADNPAAVSREHVIVESKSGLITVAGGKLTTHRAMAQQLIDQAQKKLGRDSGIAPKSTSTTASTPLAVAGELALPHVPQSTAQHLIEAYGADAIEALRLAESDPALAKPIDPALPYLQAEVRYAVENEMAVTLCDVLMRRTHVIYESADGAARQAGAIASHMGTRLGWDESRMRCEVAEYERQVAMTRAFRKRRMQNAA